MTRSRECVAFTVDEAFDLESHLDVAAAIEALACAALAGLELRKLRLPKAEDVGFNLADAGYVANFEIETVWDDRRFVDALGGKLRGHKGQMECVQFCNAPNTNRSIGHVNA